MKVASIDGAGRLVSVATEFADLTSAGGTISSSGGLSDSYPATNLFDDDLATFACRGSTSSNPIIVDYDFGEATLVNRYRIYAYTSVGSPGFPKDWTFEGSDDGTDWTVLDRRIGVSMTKGNWYSYDFDNGTSYRHYRLNVTDGSRGTARLDIGEVEYGFIDRGRLCVDIAGLPDSDISGLDVSGDVELETSGDSFALDADLDMRGFPVSATIDLRGNTLLVDALSGGGTVTDTSETTFSTPVSATASMTLSNPVENLFDGDTSTIAYTGSTTYVPIALVFDFGSATAIDHYSIYVNALEIVRSPGFPKEWTFEGSDDGAAWTVLDRRDVAVSIDNWYDFDFSNGAAYRYYRMRVTKGSRYNASNGSNPRLDFGGEMKFGRRAASGRLVVEVPASTTVENADVEIAGNVRLVKTGAGTLVASVSGQTHVGGTEILAGTLRCGAAAAGLFGADGAEILVATNGTFDIAGKRKSGVNALGKYDFRLNGGTLANSSAHVLDSYNYESAMRISLVSDSSLDTTAFGLLGTETAGLYAGIDFGGHTLSCSIANGQVMRLYNMTLENGNFKVENATTGRIFIGYNGGVVATNVDFTLNGQVVVRNDSIFKVRGYEPLGTAINDTTQYGAMEVYGTFRPTGDYFYGCTLMDGATLDLSTRTTTLNALSASTGGLTNLAFAANATINVSLGSKRFGNAPILSWTEATKPANVDTVTFVRADANRNYTLFVKEDGLYAQTGFVISVR